MLGVEVNRCVIIELTMPCWVYGVLEGVWESGTPCLELLKTSDWDREEGWVASMGVFSVSEEEEGGVFPSNTARSILLKKRNTYNYSKKHVIYFNVFISSPCAAFWTTNILKRVDLT